MLAVVGAVSATMEIVPSVLNALVFQPWPPGRASLSGSSRHCPQ
jgi:hypothetical protein